MPSRDFCTLPHKTSNVHAVFEKLTLKFCTHVQCVPAEPFTNVFFCFFCFLLCWKTGIPQDPNIKNTKPQISGEKKRKEKKRTHSWKARQGHIKHVCKIPGSISPKRRGHWTLKEFGVLCFNQPVPVARFSVSSRYAPWWDWFVQFRRQNYLEHCSIFVEWGAESLAARMAGLIAGMNDAMGVRVALPTTKPAGIRKPAKSTVNRWKNSLAYIHWLIDSRFGRLQTEF